MTVTPAKRTISLKLIMGNPAPDLTLQTVDHGRWSLEEQTPQNFTMVVFYRGLHCPICLQYIEELEQKLPEFLKLGVDAIAISGDSLDLTQKFKAQAHIQHLPLGYGLTRQQMYSWGLYMSKGYFPQEPEHFSEPALYLIKPNGELYLANLGTHPFSRINFDSLLKGLEYVIPNHYPTRGTE